MGSSLLSAAPCSVKTVRGSPSSICSQCSARLGAGLSWIPGTYYPVSRVYHFINRRPAQSHTYSSSRSHYFQPPQHLGDCPWDEGTVTLARSCAQASSPSGLRYVCLRPKSAASESNLIPSSESIGASPRLDSSLLSAAPCSVKTVRGSPSSICSQCSARLGAGLSWIRCIYLYIYI